MKKLTVTFLLFTLIALQPVNATINASPLKYNISGSGSYYPYYTNDAKYPGIMPEIIEKVLTEANIEALHVTLPTKRILNYLENEMIDFDVISIQWLSKEQRKDPRYVFSEPLIAATETVISLPQDIAQWQQISAIYNKNIGTVMGYYYHDEKLFNRIDFPSEKALIQALAKRRVSAIIMGKLTAQYWANELGLDIAYGALHSHGFLRIRLLSKHKALLSELNEAIQYLHSEGEITAIAEKYTSPITIQK